MKISQFLLDFIEGVLCFGSSFGNSFERYCSISMISDIFPRVTFTPRATGHSAYIYIYIYITYRGNVASRRSYDRLIRSTLLDFFR